MAFRQYADTLSAALGYVSPAEYPQIWTTLSSFFLGRWAQAVVLAS